MTIPDFLTDPFLLSVLDSTSATLDQSLHLLSLVESPPVTTDSRNPSNETLLTISKQQKRLFSLLAQLRGLNRNAILGVRQTKQATAEARQEIDRLHLQLQNLYYEQRHLMNEISACESYEYVPSPSSGPSPSSTDLASSHKYTTLPLLPVDEFLALFPEHNDSTPHDLMIARINHEHAERQALENSRQELLKQKQALIAENKKRKDDLAELDASLERFIDVSCHQLSIISIWSGAREPVWLVDQAMKEERRNEKEDAGKANSING